MRQRHWLLAAAGGLLLLAVLLPTGWYETIPRKPGMILPFSGVLLLRLTFLVEALVLLLLAVRNVRFVSHNSVYGSLIPRRRDFPPDISRSTAIAAVVLITAVGIVLRIYRLDQDLWLDEISPILDYMKLTPIQVMGSYLRSNNHLLNTLLEKISIGMLGEHEWSARLPAVFFGSAAVPLMYWLARTSLSRAAAVGASLVLAASYHHIFFSQNARGYTGYLFFALLATGLLVGASRDDRLWRWALYVAAIVLGSASLLITAFVIMAHFALCAVIGVRLRREHKPLAPFLRRIVSAFGVAGFLAFQIYSAALPEVYVVINTIYADPATGYPPFSAEFLTELMRGIGAGFGSPAVAAGFLAFGLLGFIALAIYAWPLALSLGLVPVLTALLLAVRGLTFSPRFFLLGLPLAILAAMSALQWIAIRTRRPGILLAGGAFAALAVGRSLPWYYRTPKQPYRAALSFVEKRGGDGKILVLFSAENGIRYYAHRLPVRDSTRYVYTRTDSELDSLTRMPGHSPPQVITTFSRALRIEYPAMSLRLERDWRADTTFAATVGDGEVTVWSPRGLPQR